MQCEFQLVRLYLTPSPGFLCLSHYLMITVLIKALESAESLHTNNLEYLLMDDRSRWCGMAREGGDVKFLAKFEEMGGGGRKFTRWRMTASRRRRRLLRSCLLDRYFAGLNFLLSVRSCKLGASTYFPLMQFGVFRILLSSAPSSWLIIFCPQRGFLKVSLWWFPLVNSRNDITFSGSTKPRRGGRALLTVWPDPMFKIYTDGECIVALPWNFLH